MSLVQSIESLFVARSSQLFWARLPDQQVPDFHPEPIALDEAYVVLRLREMSLKYARKLWRKYYPILHGFLRHGGREEHQIVGPGQLKDISESNLERVVNLNQRLAGPVPYNGEDLEVVAGLYSVPAGDAAKALIQTVGDLAGMAGLAVGQIPQIATAVKSGVESLFNLNDCQLQLGVRDTRPAGRPLTTGVYVGIAARREQLKLDALWLAEGHLIQGEDPIAGAAVEEYDYFVLEIERRASREDWATLPGISDQEKRFAEVMRTTSTNEEKRKQLATIWPSFVQSLAESRDLTKPDRERIKAGVAADLNSRLSSNNPFETRSVGTEVRKVSSSDFDFFDVDTDNPDVGVLRPNPFT